MTGVNWGIANQGGGFQNALAMVTQMGAQARQVRQQNALLEQRQQALDLQRERQQGEMQKEAQTSDLTRRVLEGDESAMTELATVNFPRWEKLDANRKTKATEEAKVFGQASLDLLQVPYEQRRGRIIQYAQQFPEYAEQINQLAFLSAEQQDLALRGQVIEAQMVGKLHQMESPRYQAIPEGGTLVNTKDSGAVRQFQGQPSGGLSVVRTGRDASGRRVVELSDGSIQYAD